MCNEVIPQTSRMVDLAIGYQAAPGTCENAGGGCWGQGHVTVRIWAETDSDALYYTRATIV